MTTSFPVEGLGVRGSGLRIWEGECNSITRKSWSREVSSAVFAVQAGYCGVHNASNPGGVRSNVKFPTVLVTMRLDITVLDVSVRSLNMGVGVMVCND